jgi:hypothetical protein
MRLRTERADSAKPAAPDGQGFVVLMVRGEHLALNDAPAPVNQKMDGSQVLLFQHRASAAMWAVLTAWDDLAAGKVPKVYQVRPICYKDASALYNLRVVEGPLQCTLGGALEAGQFWIPPQGLEKPGSTILSNPAERMQQRQPRR